MLTPLQSRRPRPDFESIASQPPTSPLVLDSSRGVQVNPAINRWLRDYQREGVQFFYERYKEDRGGILGDDMGLGKLYDIDIVVS
jgi:DNA excision repair protein ERCC-6-like 2